MAITAQNSTQVTNENAGIANISPSGKGRIFSMYFSFTQSGIGSATSTAGRREASPR